VVTEGLWNDRWVDGASGQLRYYPLLNNSSLFVMFSAPFDFFCLSSLAPQLPSFTPSFPSSHPALLPSLHLLRPKLSHHLFWQTTTSQKAMNHAMYGTRMEILAKIKVINDGEKHFRYTITSASLVCSQLLSVVLMLML